MTHTEGPWSVIHHDEWRKLPSWEQPSTVCHAGDYVIVTDGPSYEFHGPDEADAALIAAAPKMLTALQCAAQALDALHPLGGRLVHPTPQEMVERTLAIVNEAIALTSTTQGTAS